MIHNNFRKLIKRFMGAGTSNASDTRPLYYDYVDIDGYTGTSSDACARYAAASTFASTNLSNRTLSDLRSYSATGGGVLYYVAIGNSTENEPDYTLGTTLSSYITYSTSSNKEYDLLAVSTIANIGTTDVTFDEMGLFIHVWSSSTSYKWNDSRYFDVLLIKEKLDAPRTIPANSSISITFNLFEEVTIS